LFCHFFATAQKSNPRLTGRAGKNAAAAEKIAKNQFITLKENILAPQESWLRHIFFFNAP
jgi:hypothetical protein